MSALGSCSATDVVLLLQDQGFEVKGLENTVTFALTESEPRLYKYDGFDRIRVNRIMCSVSLEHAESLKILLATRHQVLNEVVTNLPSQFLVGNIMFISFMINHIITNRLTFYGTLQYL